MSPFESTRRILHHAVQVVAAPGASLLPRREDHHNRNVGWSPSLPGFVGWPIEGVQAGLRLARPAWVILHDGVVHDELPVQGRSRADGLSWLSEAWPVASALELPGYDIPEHEFGAGQVAEELDGDAVAAMLRLYGRAQQLFSEVAAAEGGSTPRVWPHHFDLATLIELDGAGEQGRSIGLSATPGDGSIGAPYLSVSPWPYPDAKDLAALSEGRWHTDGFTAAVMELPSEPDIDALRSFLDEAIRACRGVLKA